MHEIGKTKNKTSVRAESKNSKNTIGSSNNIITDNQTDFNPNVKESEEMSIQNWNEQDHPRDELGKFTEKGGGSAKDYYESEYQEALKEIAEGKDYAQINYHTQTIK